MANLKTYLQSLFKLSHTQAFADVKHGVAPSLPDSIVDTTITAPFGGYFAITCITTTANQQLRIYVDGERMTSSFVSGNTAYVIGFVPVNKGSQVRILSFGGTSLTKQNALFIPLTGHTS